MDIEMPDCTVGVETGNVVTEEALGYLDELLED